MQIITGTDFKLNTETAVTIGKFDGIHVGHRELIDRVLGVHNSNLCKQVHAKYSSEISGEKSGLKSVIFTFDKSPMEFFKGDTMPSLTTRDEKIRIFQYLGIDYLVEFPFNQETAKTPPDEFVKNYLVDRLNAKYIVAGTDLSFGNKGLGDVNLIKKMSSSLDYDYEIVDKIRVNNEEVSSTLIREYVSKGNMEKARELIGVPYALNGVIKHGNRIGRTIGFPTVNIEISSSKVMPPFGVYFTEISIDGNHYNGITNVGTKPTISDDKTVFAETNILNFNEDAYGRNATVKLLHFSRPERKFEGLDALKNQISTDIKNGHSYFGI